MEVKVYKRGTKFKELLDIINEVESISNKNEVTYSIKLKNNVHIALSYEICELKIS